MAEQIPINKVVLKWARERAGVSLDNLEKSFPKLYSWEDEDSSTYPTYSQLERLAKKYHRPLALFFFSEPPEEESVEKAFRSISEADLKDLPPSMSYMFRKAKAFQISLQELHQGDEATQKQKISWLHEVDISTDVKTLASEVRDKLGVDSSQQKSWKDSDVAFKTWRSILSDYGIYVFKEAFKADGIAGFCIYDELFPIIFINNSNQSDTRQIFTLFHELGHLIYQNSYLDFTKNRIWDKSEKQSEKDEIKCNKFAGHFLLPDSDFEELALNETTDFSDNYLSKIAKNFHVSREVVLRRILDKKLISSKIYSERVKGWEDAFLQKKQKEKSAKKEKKGGFYYSTKIAYLGDAYLSLVIQKHFRENINIEQASDYLDTKIKSFNKLQDVFLERKTGQ